MAQTVLLHFRYPSDEILVAIRELISRLEICSPERYAPPHVVESDAIRGSLALVIELLTADLRQDFSENERQSAEWNGSFDYVVAPALLVDGALAVKTRLYSTIPDSKQGSIFYSRVIERVGVDSYLFWPSDADAKDEPPSAT